MQISVSRRGPLVLALAMGTGESDRVVGSAARAAVESSGGASAVSISHRDGRAVAVAAPGGTRVGVDLERAGAVPRSRERYFLTARERHDRGRLDGSTLWALKEAAWKAFRCDPSLPFTALELELSARGEVRAVRVRGARCPVNSELRRLCGGYVLAVLWTEGGA